MPGGLGPEQDISVKFLPVWDLTHVKCLGVARGRGGGRGDGHYGFDSYIQWGSESYVHLLAIASTHVLAICSQNDRILLATCLNFARDLIASITCSRANLH